MSSGKLLSMLRKKQPLIHHISNLVTLKDCAQVTSCIGALPVMADALEEVEEITTSSSALLLNTGTFSSGRLEVMQTAGRAAGGRSIPVVLDPVGAGASSLRTRSVTRILQDVKPVILKGNYAEISAAAGMQAEIRGVHSLQRDEPGVPNAKKLLSAINYPAVVAVTGKVNYITDGRREAYIYNGHFLMPHIVGSGCMLSSLCAAFAAVSTDPFYAAVAAFASAGVTAEIAAVQAGNSLLGPVDFKQRFLDALFYLNPHELDSRAKIEIK